MVTYPISVTRKTYRGSKEAILRKTNEYNRIAGELERYVNERIREQEESTKVYKYYQIASATGYPLKLVREILYDLDGGHHGFTAKKPADLDGLE